MSDLPPIDPLYSYEHVAKLLDPSGSLRLTARSIRSEVQKGDLASEKFAGKCGIRHSELVR